MRVEKNDWLAGLHWYSLDKIESVEPIKLMLKVVNIFFQEQTIAAIL